MVPAMVGRRSRRRRRGKRRRRAKNTTKETAEEELKQPDILEWTRQRAAQIEEMKRKQRENSKCWRSREKSAAAASQPGAEAAPDQQGAKRQPEKKRSEPEQDTPQGDGAAATTKKAKTASNPITGAAELVVPHTFQEATGWQWSKYIKDAKPRMLHKRPSDVQPPPQAALALCGQVRPFSYGEGENGEHLKWWVYIGPACPETATLPVRNVVSWLKQYSLDRPDIFMIDFGQQTFTVEPKKIKDEIPVEVVVDQKRAMVQIPTWNVLGDQQ
jgi:hypothetical protein